MADRTKIEWTQGPDGSPGATWNPLVGTRGRWHCTKISSGCQACYAERLNVRFGGPKYVVGADEVRLDEDALTLPLRWRKPRRIFVGSMTDLFEGRVLDLWLDRIFAVTRLAPQHTYLLLTKRPERMQKYFTAKWKADDVTNAMIALSGGQCDNIEWPLPNVWLGVSCETQPYANERIPWLLETPAAVRFVSCEPLLSPIDLTPYIGQISLVIVGGESGGPPERALVTKIPPEMPRNEDGDEDWDVLTDYVARGPWWIKPEALEWIRSIRDQCQAAGVPFFFKQFGGPRPKSAGRLLDGRTWNDVPT